MGKMTLEEFFERKNSAAKHLKEALETNLEMFDKLSKKDKELLMRLNLISIRNCLQDYGDES